MDCSPWMNGRHFSTILEPAHWPCAFNYTALSSNCANVLRLNAIQNVGQLAALPFCAFACDHFGRKWTLVLGASIILVGTVLQGAAQNSKYYFPAQKFD